MSQQSSSSPSAPRLDPLSSPGPVTPLVLEDAGGYLASGSTSSACNLGGDSSTMSDTIDRLIAREAEQSRQRTSKTNAKGR